MRKINEKREQEGLRKVKPCEIFDLIGGTSTGGLIAIMLGRLEMDVQQCIDAYRTLSRDIFSNPRVIGVNWRGNVRARFDSQKLERAVKDIIKSRDLPEDSLLDDGAKRDSKVFACSISKENKDVIHLCSYPSDRVLLEKISILEAARATSAATSFFDPIQIGPHGQKYVDGALSCNNPVDEVWREAQDLWCQETGDLKDLVKCFISIGTGNPGLSPIHDNAFNFLNDDLVALATETEKTARNFEITHRGLLEQPPRYYRFNVEQGLQEVGLEEFEKENIIVSNTNAYLGSQQEVFRVRDCADNLKLKECLFWQGDRIELRRTIISDLQAMQEEFMIPFFLSAAPEIQECVGRDEDVSKMANDLLPCTISQRRVLVLHGLGGIGKTQLAIKFSQQHQYDYSAVFWFDAKTEDTLKQSFRSHAGRVKGLVRSMADRTTELDDVDQNVKDLKLWLAKPGNHRWLLIFDNVDNPKVPDNKDPGAFDIKTYFPEANQGSIIITTRVTTLCIGKMFSVEKLSDPREGLAVLTSTSSRDFTDDNDALSLAIKLDGLPLALATAGSYLSLESVSPADYLRLYDRSWEQLQRTSPRLLSYEDRELYSTWLISYERIKQENESAAQLLQLWAYFDSQDLWYDLLRHCENFGPEWFRQIALSELNFNAAVRTLQKFAFAKGRKGSNGYSIHTCLHAWSMGVLNKQPDFEKFEMALRCIVFSDPGYMSVDQLRLAPHASRLVSLADIFVNEAAADTNIVRVCATAFQECGRLHFDHGLLVQAEELYLAAIKTLAKEPLLNIHLQLDALQDLGILHIEQGKIEAAEVELSSVFDSRMELNDDSAIVKTCHNLSIVYGKLGKLKEEENILLLALSWKEKLLGPEDISTLQTNIHRATNSKAQGRLSEAEEILQRTLVKLERHPQNHPARSLALYNLGNLYIEMGKFTQARDRYIEAVTGREASLGPDHPDTLTAIYNLAVCYEVSLGDLAKAEETWKHLLFLYHRKFGMMRAKQTATHLIRCYFKQGKLKEAIDTCEWVLAEYRRVLGTNAQQTLQMMISMVSWYREVGNREMALNVINQAVEGYQQTLGPQHPQTLAALQLRREL
ncbi:hypothetical protein N7499_006350 [Penicillium canescens]|nr:hypothetical protein N7499_006350 [Penicillium canescens]KAJ6176727.1 hypothetical protein N7485_003641 [Penicillium canescens]